MKKVMVIVDVQVDFVFGALRNEEAISRLPVIRMLLEYAKTHNFDKVILTRDTHNRDSYFDTQEGRNLPIFHCGYEEDGWQICEEILVDGINYIFIDKCQYGTLGYFNEIKDADIVVMGGFDTEYCVISQFVNIRTMVPEAVVYVAEDACAGATKEMHEKALDIMRVQNGKVMKWEDMKKELEALDNAT